MHVTSRLAALAGATVALLATAAASAAPIYTSIGADLSAGTYTFNTNNSAFTFGSNGQIFTGPITVQTAGGGEVNTIFGQPTTNFIDRGTVTFGPNMQYTAFPTATPVRFSNGDNFIGLRATDAAGQQFYGFAYTTNSRLNSIGFETTAGAAITATAAVPEPAAWAMMIGGFGLVGGGLRRRQTVRVRYA